MAMLQFSKTDGTETLPIIELLTLSTSTVIPWFAYSLTALFRAAARRCRVCSAPFRSLFSIPVSGCFPFGGPASAKGQALKEANIFCESQGREILLDHMQASECAFHGGCGEAEIYFFCLVKDDPQLKRQKYSPDPTQKIEIDQR